jgi:protein involved in polysaccharide export with SLBB domain
MSVLIICHLLDSSSPRRKALEAKLEPHLRSEKLLAGCFVREGLAQSLNSRLLLVTAPSLSKAKVLADEIEADFGDLVEVTVWRETSNSTRPDYPLLFP